MDDVVLFIVVLAALILIVGALGMAIMAKPMWGIPLIAGLILAGTSLDVIQKRR